MALIKVLRTIEFIADSVYGLIPRRSPTIDQCAKAKVIVHRGWTQYGKNIENTLDSFRDCLGKGLFGIEFDIRWTKDLVPVVHHDETLKRLFKDNRKLSELDFNQLRTEFPLIPSLAEVVSEFGKKIHLLIELKEEPFFELEKQREVLKSTLADLNEGEDFHILSLTNSTFEKFNDFDKSTMVLVSTTNPGEFSKIVEEKSYGGLMGHFVLMSKGHTEKLSKTILGTGFPRNQNSFKREICRTEIEWIFTNHPDTFIRYREKRLKRLSLNSRF